MKKKVLLTVVLFVVGTMFLSGCDLIKGSGGQDGVVETLSHLLVQLTMQASEISRLETQAAKPTEQPQECPTQIPMEPTPICPVCPVCPPTAEPTPMPTATEQPQGSISGSLSYPSEFIPAQRVVAYNISTGYYYWVRTAEGFNSYTISGLPAGRYKVVAYVQIGDVKFKGGYSFYAACDFTCAEDHTLVEFELKNGEHKTGINPTDWYAPQNIGWPDEPKN